MIALMPTFSQLPRPKLTMSKLDAADNELRKAMAKNSRPYFRISMALQNMASGLDELVKWYNKNQPPYFLKEKRAGIMPAIQKAADLLDQASLKATAGNEDSVSPMQAAHINKASHRLAVATKDYKAFDVGAFLDALDHISVALREGDTHDAAALVSKVPPLVVGALGRKWVYFNLLGGEKPVKLSDLIRLKSEAVETNERLKEAMRRHRR